MADAPSQEARQRTVAIKLPEGGIRFVTKELLLRVLGLLIRGEGFRLQVDGATETADGRFKVPPGVPGEEGDGGDEYTGWEPPEGSCGCDSNVELRAKLTTICGRAECCGEIYTVDDPPYTKNYSLVTVTQQCTLYDNTGGSLVTSDCVRISTTDFSVSTDGTANGGCEASPDCGEADAVLEDGCDAPLCSGAPAPGFKCYTVDSTETSYGKFCEYGNLGAAAEAGADETVEPEFTMLDPVSMEGLITQFDGYQLTRYSWEFFRFGRRIPAHLILGIEEGDLILGADTTYEDVVTIAADTDSGIYEMTMPAAGCYVKIVSAELIYGKLPPP